MSNHQKYTILSPDEINWLRQKARTTPEGWVVVAGTYKGGDVMAMIDAAPDRKFLVVDSFKGLPDTTNDGTIHTKGEFDAGGIKQYRSNFADAGCRLPDEIAQMWITEKNLKKVADREVAFVWLDLDLYQPTFDSINHFVKMIVPGGVIATHDYKFVNCPGIERAVKDSGLEFKVHGNIAFHTLS